jgi:uncharacterized protein (DUF952 family)
MSGSIAYKILTAEQFRALEEDRFEGAPVDLADGYVHLSTADQVAGTLDAHFAGQTELFLAAVDLDAAGPAVRWEKSRGGALFPHLYRRLGRDLILASAPVRRAADGSVLFPA